MGMDRDKKNKPRHTSARRQPDDRWPEAKGRSRRSAGPKKPVSRPSAPAPESRPRTAEPQELPPDVLVGRNAVTEALRSGRGINKLLVAQGDHLGSIGEIERLAHERRIPVEYVARQRIEQAAGGHRHQGVLAYVAPVAYAELSDILEQAAARTEPPVLLLLDDLEDPHNLGALLRTADAAGIAGVLIPRRRSVPRNATVAKTSAGAIEYVPVARIGNIAQTLKELKEKGFWVAGADMAGEKDYTEADLTGPLVLVVGGEGKGLSRLTRENCDFLVSLPMVGRINSLNASVAGSLLMYESLRQRRQKNKKK